MVNIEDVLKPYEDSQPSQLIVPTKVGEIQRIPPLVTPDGMINSEFQTFYNKIVASMLHDPDSLYEISDNVLNYDDFKALLRNTWLNYLCKFFKADEKCRSIDIELNMDRFQDIHRNILGGFNVITCLTVVEPDEFNSNNYVTHVEKGNMEILFRYRDKFQIISKFEPFKLEVL